MNGNLSAFLRRSYQRPDRSDFTPTAKTGWTLAAYLMNCGVSAEATLVAVQAVTPEFDWDATS
jgi:hypothetical protein